MMHRAPLLSSALTRVFFLQIALLTAVMIGLGFLVTHVLVHVWPFTLEDQAVRALVAARTPTLDRVSNVVSLTCLYRGPRHRDGRGWWRDAHRLP